MNKAQIDMTLSLSNLKRWAVCWGKGYYTTLSNVVRRCGHVGKTIYTLLISLLLAVQTHSINNHCYYCYRLLYVAKAVFTPGILPRCIYLWIQNKWTDKTDVLKIIISRINCYEPT